MRGFRRRARRGVSLVEALVATAIAALLIGGTYEVLAGGAVLTQRVDARQTALDLAQRVMDRGPGGGTSGQEGTFTWRLSTEPSPFDPAGAGPDGLQLRVLTVEVVGPNLGRPVRLSAERVIR